MSTINIDLGEATQLNVLVGQQDENEVQSVVFDFSDWYTAYGSGTLSLSIQRSKDEWPYAGELTIDSANHTGTWEISDTDSAYAGVGQIQLSYTVGTAVKKSVVYRFTVYRSLGANGNVITPVQIQDFIDEVEDALEDIEADIAEIKADLQNAGMSEEFKQALHNILENVAYINDDGQDYLDALDSAMWPPADLVSITCVYTPTFTVLDTTILSTLKQDLVVTAHYADESTETITNYSLSGTLAEGTNTITVSYSGKTTTFTVTCPHTTVTYIASTDAQYVDTDFKLGYTDEVQVKMKDDYTSNVDKTYWGCADASNHRVQMGPYKTNTFDAYSARWTGDALPSNHGITRITNAIAILEWRNVSSTKKDFRVYNESGTLVGSCNVSNNSSANLPDYPIYIFTRNTAGVAGATSIWKLYEFIVWDENGNERLHLIPVTKNSVACLYDSVSDDYLYNAGSGSFDYA